MNNSAATDTARTAHMPALFMPAHMTTKEMYEEEEYVKGLLEKKRMELRELTQQQDRVLHHVVSLKSRLEAIREARRERMAAFSIQEAKLDAKRDKKRMNILAAISKRLPGSTFRERPQADGSREMTGHER